MSTVHEAVAWVPLFPDEEIPFILTAVLRCTTGLRKEHPTEHENDISDRLRDLLDQDAGLRTRPVEIFREVPLYDRKRPRKKPLGRSDIMFLYSTDVRKPWPYFVMESKRLRVKFPSGPRSLISEYVTGHQGMMCFIEQRYARDLASGGMLGYVFDGNVEGARSAVSTAIRKNHAKLKCAQPFRLMPSLILPEDSRVSETTHVLAHGNFIVYHSLRWRLKCLGPEQTLRPFPRAASCGLDGAFHKSERRQVGEYCT